ncbi:MAG: carboxypeptidase regulatory-like domain-containing protein [Calditrichaeota bacterium]|nr:carboxypeptidase regulatory-like domain-containing protein [Calditrichota bacterium]
MKKATWITFIAFILLILTNLACFEDDKTSPTGPSEASLEGKWLRGVLAIDGVLQDDFEYFFYVFSGDGTGQKLDEEEHETGSIQWEISGDQLTIKQGDDEAESYECELSNNALILERGNEINAFFTHTGAEDEVAICGAVCDYHSGSPLNGAEVSIIDPSETEVSGLGISDFDLAPTAVTGSAGNYSMNYNKLAWNQSGHRFWVIGGAGIECIPASDVEDITRAYENTTHQCATYKEVSTNEYSKFIVVEPILLHANNEPDHGTITGVVKDAETGFGIPYCKIVANDVNRIHTDQHGHYKMWVIGGYSSIVAGSGEYEPESKTVTVEVGETIEVNFDLKKAATGTVTGKVIDAWGNPIRSVNIRSDDYREIDTDEGGDYSIELTLGNRELTATKDGYVTKLKDVEVELNGNYRVDWVLEEAEADTGRVYGKVLDPDTNDPVPGAHINSDDNRLTTSDAEGNYSFYVSAGRRTLTVSKTGYGSKATQVEVTAGGTHQIDLRIGAKNDVGTVYGTITVTGLDEVIQGALITADDGNSTLSDELGNYTFQISPGRRDISASKQGYITETVNNNIIAGQQHQRNFSLSRVPTTGSIMGWVRNALSDVPIQGAIVSAGGVSFTTDQWGAYVLNSIEAGVHTMTAFKEGYVISEKDVEVLSGRDITVNFELELETHGTVRGVVTSELNCEPLDSVKVYSGEDTTQTDSSGRYSLRLWYGDNSVFFSKPYYEVEMDVIEVIGGENVVFDCSLNVISATVLGNITDSISSEPISGVSISSDDGYSTTTDLSGNYRFQLGKGNRTITFSCEYYLTQTRELEAEPENEYTVNLILVPR